LANTVKNQGGGSANASVTEFYLSTDSVFDTADVLIGSRNVPVLAASAVSTATTMVTIPQGTATGLWYIIAKADADGTVPETSETNNTYSRSIQVGPDLVVSALSGPGTAAAGQITSWTDTSKNQGGGSAGVSVTKFYLSTNSTLDTADLLIGTRNVPGLEPGTVSSGSSPAMIPQGTTTGLWYIIAKADADGSVSETSETNNTYARSIQIVAGSN
jgi:subtilase family serine protease